MAIELLLPVSEFVFFLGLSLFLGYTSSIILQRIGIPNVLTYILIGAIVGNIVHVYSPGYLQSEAYEYWFVFVEEIALGLIGFKIGTEMELKLLREQSKMITIITLLQVLITFLVVFVGAYLVIGNFLISLIFGGLATATAPAATVEIIRKFRAKGYLTTRVQWILAFDDVVAVLIVEGIIAYAAIVLVGEVITPLLFLISIGREIFLAILLGLVIGFFLDLIIENMHAEESRLEMMEISLGALILVIGIAMVLHTSVILATMAVGAITVNREGNNYKEAGNLLEIIMSPILIIFFVLVGAELLIDIFNPFPWFAIVYFITRAIGKIYGTNFAAKLADAKPVVRKNLGLTMLPQGGVALGLMTVASELYFESGLEHLGTLLLSTIVISTVFSEGIGSFASLTGLRRAGELNKNPNGEAEQIDKGEY